jgi:hypothetical protein
MATAQDEGQDEGQDGHGSPASEERSQARGEEPGWRRGAGLEERSLYRERRCQAGGDKPS